MDLGNHQFNLNKATLKNIDDVLRKMTAKAFSRTARTCKGLLDLAENTRNCGKVHSPPTFVIFACEDNKTKKIWFCVPQTSRAIKKSRSDHQFAPLWYRQPINRRTFRAIFSQSHFIIVCSEQARRRFKRMDTMELIDYLRCSFKAFHFMGVSIKGKYHGSVIAEISALLPHIHSNMLNFRGLYLGGCPSMAHPSRFKKLEFEFAYTFDFEKKKNTLGKFEEIDALGCHAVFPATMEKWIAILKSDAAVTKRIEGAAFRYDGPLTMRGVNKIASISAVKNRKYDFYILQFARGGSQRHALICAQTSVYTFGKDFTHPAAFYYCLEDYTDCGPCDCPTAFCLRSLAVISEKMFCHIFKIQSAHLLDRILQWDGGALDDLGWILEEAAANH